MAFALDKTLDVFLPSQYHKFQIPESRLHLPFSSLVVLLLCDVCQNSPLFSVSIVLSGALSLQLLCFCHRESGSDFPVHQELCWGEFILRWQICQASRIERDSHAFNRQLTLTRLTPSPSNKYHAFQFSSMSTTANSLPVAIPTQFKGGVWVCGGSRRGRLAHEPISYQCHTVHSAIHDPHNM